MKLLFKLIPLVFLSTQGLFSSEYDPIKDIRNQVQAQIQLANEQKDLQKQQAQILKLNSLYTAMQASVDEQINKIEAEIASIQTTQELLIKKVELDKIYLAKIEAYLDQKYNEFIADPYKMKLLEEYLKAYKEKSIPEKLQIIQSAADVLLKEDESMQIVDGQYSSGFNSKYRAKIDNDENIVKIKIDR